MGSGTDGRPSVRSLRVLKLIAMLHENRSRLLEVISFLPPDVAAEFGIGGSLEVESRESFRLELREGPAEERCSAEYLGWTLVPRVCEAGGSAALRVFISDKEAQMAAGERWQSSISCLFVAEAAERGLTIFTEEDFVDILRLATVMCFLGDLSEQHDIVTAYARESGMQHLLKVLKEGNERLGQIVVCLPQQVRDVLLASSFAQRCLAEFDAVDTRAAASLELKVLLPVLVALGLAERLNVTIEQCVRFRDFIAPEDSMIQRAEVVSCCQFMLALAYLDTREGQVAADNACIVLGERRVEELLVMLEQDKHAVTKTELLLPGDVADYLASSSFAEQCQERFQQLDQGQKGVLESPDVFHVVSELSGADPFAVSLEQCDRFVAIFGTCGALSVEEFSVLARHLCIMSFLHSEKGRGHLSWALESLRRGHYSPTSTGTVDREEHFGQPFHAISSTTLDWSVSMSSPVLRSSSPLRSLLASKEVTQRPELDLSDLEHLSKDAQFYMHKSQRLEEENKFLTASLLKFQSVSP
ncbi:unnamed protein product [Polarella glacialis]|uniref:Uncharacterized protein n=1 Tax=Polarella glacialis TaxID=89957 RepID=A0A813FC85_POLGL|nr:unnamed protein product [Polarella glacialis]